MADKYPLTPEIECQVVYACTTTPRFMRTLGHAISPELMPTEAAGLVVQAVQAIAKKTPCTDTSLALQNIRMRVNQGQLTHSQLTDASDYIDTCEDVGETSDLEGLLATVTPIIQRSLHKDAVENAITDFGKGAPVAKAVNEFSKIASLGERSVHLGHEGVGLLADIKEAAVSTLENPLPTGIAELDAALHGGLEQHALGLVMASSGDGKSLFLSSIAAQSVYDGIDTAVVTLELDEASWRQRLYANVCQMTPEDMKNNTAEAVRRYGMLQKRKSGIGRWVVAYMSPLATTADDIRTWLRDLRNERNFNPDLLIVDYADKMISKHGGEKQRSYEAMRDVYEGMRKIANEDRTVKWLWTASQTRDADRKKKRSLDDASDSKWKIRTADLVVGIERTEDDCEDGLIRFRIPKRRNAAAHGEVGPVPMDAEHWRITRTDRGEGW